MTRVPLIALLMGILVTMNHPLAANEARILDFNDIIAAELAFSEAAVDSGMRTAFLHYMAPDGILFRPHPVTAQEWYATNDPPGLLSWRPVFVQLSAAGDLGLSTGPWEYRKSSPDDPAIAHGHYISVWKRQANGEWRVVIDSGNNHAAPDSLPPVVIKKLTLTHVALDPDRAKDRLLQTDQAMAARATADGFPTAFEAQTTPDVRLYRNGHLPFQGQSASLAHLKNEPQPLTWQPTDAQVSEKGAFGYTYGLAEDDKNDYTYLRIWQRTLHDWRLIVDVLNPVPAESE